MSGCRSRNRRAQRSLTRGGDPSESLSRSRRRVTFAQSAPGRGEQVTQFVQAAEVCAPHLASIRGHSILHEAAQAQRTLMLSSSYIRFSPRTRTATAWPRLHGKARQPWWRGDSVRRWKLLPVDVVKVASIRPNVSFRCQAPVRVLPTRALRAEPAGNEQVEVILDDAQAPAPRRRVE